MNPPSLCRKERLAHQRCREVTPDTAGLPPPTTTTPGRPRPTEAKTHRAAALASEIHSKQQPTRIPPPRPPTVEQCRPRPPPAPPKHIRPPPRCPPQPWWHNLRPGPLVRRITYIKIYSQGNTINFRRSPCEISLKHMLKNIQHLENNNTSIVKCQYK